VHRNEIAELASATADYSAEALLAWAAERFGPRLSLTSSLGAEDQVLTDMIWRASLPIGIFTIDTGRLPQETFDVLQATRDRYGLDIDVLFPAASDVETLVTRSGPNSFRRTVTDRKQCCHIRKVLPLRRRLAGLDAWITGLRREQTLTRADVVPVQWDEANELIKINPLAGWSNAQVWEYIRQHGVPYNALHDQGYPSIGCAACTRAVAPGEDIRAGRWWWEQPEHRECGLHVVGGRLVRAAKEHTP
jgi:phosphoadenosine phosphosulfate reductase